MNDSQNNTETDITSAILAIVILLAFVFAAYMLWKHRAKIINGGKAVTANAVKALKFG